MRPDVTRMQAKLAELRRRDTQFRVFGAARHRYLLNPCLSERQVREAENHYGISLPEDYRSFLIFIGNGGAGPHYGIFPLEYSLEHSVHEVRLLREPFPHAQAWNLEPEEVGLDRDRDYAAFDDLYFDDAYVRGALRISHEGCGYYDLLVVAGAERMHMWVDGRTGDGGIGPLVDPRHPNGRQTFSTWYERWLDEALAKQTNDQRHEPSSR